METASAADSSGSSGARVAAARKAAGLSVRDLARAAGVSPQTITSIELGQHAVTVVVVGRVAKALGRTIADLGAYEGMPEGTLAERIRKARYYHGLTIQQAAQKIGTDPSQFCAWEHGQRPTDKSLAKLDSLLAVLST